VTTPRVSIVLPTYNRRDTILRAIGSVRAQTFEDWELIVVDDGSTDGTGELVANLDRRIRLVVQENQGVGGARNAALARVRGSLVAFLDSDDEWTPHHLAFAHAFFEAHPGAHAMTTEFWEDFGDRDYVRHPRPELVEWYPATARRIGSAAFDAEPPSGDPLLWYFERREPVGPWGAAILERTPYGPGLHYRGHVFRHWRWGWLTALQPTVVTRHAADTVGPMDTRYAVASDFGWLATLCRHFELHFFSVPGAIKHEFGSGKRALAEAHLVTGRTATRFHEDVLRFHEELFWRENPDDRELSALRGFRQTLVARAALAAGARARARELLEDAVRTYPGPDTRALLWLARYAPKDRIAAMVYEGAFFGAVLAGRIRRRVRRLRARAR
jgi:glycosyltransferase involved in cell wall biosynthesis